MNGIGGHDETDSFHMHNWQCASAQELTVLCLLKVFFFRGVDVTFTSECGAAIQALNEVCERELFWTNGEASVFLSQFSLSPVLVSTKEMVKKKIRGAPTEAVQQIFRAILFLVGSLWTWFFMPLSADPTRPRRHWVWICNHAYLHECENIFHTKGVGEGSMTGKTEMETHCFKTYSIPCDFAFGARSRLESCASESVACFTSIVTVCVVLWEIGGQHWNDAIICYFWNFTRRKIWRNVTLVVNKNISASSSCLVSCAIFRFLEFLSGRRKALQNQKDPAKADDDLLLPRNTVIQVRTLGNRALKGFRSAIEILQRWGHVDFGVAYTYETVVVKD